MEPYRSPATDIVDIERQEDLSTVTYPESLRLVARRPLMGGPTPLQKLERLSLEVGVEVWMKRDDMGSPTLAGNKVRKLEFIIAEALRAGADTLITTGAAQSNSARAAAAAARTIGIRPLLLLSGERPAEPTGNLVVDWLVGAELRFVGDVDWGDLDHLVSEAAEEVRSQGGAPFTAPVGCSSPLGTLGFVAGYFELLDQLDAKGLAPERVYHASTSGGTHAGLALGRTLAERGPRPKAISAGRLSPDPVAHHLELAQRAAALLGLKAEVQIDVEVGHEGPGYGTPGPECVQAIRHLARTEAVLCDPVYSGKGLAGLLSDIEEGRVTSPVVFWHTGGWQALFHPPLRDALIR